MPPTGLTENEIIWKKNKARLCYYPAKQKKFKTPLFLVYSLINQSYILDLAPGMSMIEAFVELGYDVYLLDFGIPGLEDSDTSLDDYIVKYIEKGVKRSLYHSGAEEVTLVGYCLGGTLATIYATITKTPIKNIVLFAPPLDFGQTPIPSEWEKALRSGEFSLDSVIDEYGIIPPKIVEHVLRLTIAPITYSSYISLIKRADDEEYIKKWKLFNRWLKSHIPFAGATLKQLITDLGIDNKLIKNKLIIDGKLADLKNISSNLLVVSTTDDKIVPEELTKSIIPLVSSKDKLYKRVKGGHVTLALKGKIPSFLEEWLGERSS
ncbi:alpha/beta fold hydrolase [Bacillus tamaricis]|uniref:Alpha/beta fold hydrolase n=2 Tax=Evansella tamaricis TaxID=2069301 RepID=A0ABS6JKY2_9BACI|nr:alpha/beta fold hydrolase [Evansella tamaricis]MBU9713075.1 alpha/beta fold hydrolase [Evansella tamaricis]